MKSQSYIHKTIISGKLPSRTVLIHLPKTNRSKSKKLVHSKWKRGGGDYDQLAVPRTPRGRGTGGLKQDQKLVSKNLDTVIQSLCPRSGQAEVPSHSHRKSRPRNFAVYTSNDPDLGPSSTHFATRLTFFSSSPK